MAQQFPQELINDFTGTLWLFEVWYLDDQGVPSKFTVRSNGLVVVMGIIDRVILIAKQRDVTHCGYCDDDYCSQVGYIDEARWILINGKLTRLS